MSEKKLHGMAENNTWNSAVTLARNENPNVNMGFARKGTPLYERAKQIQARMSQTTVGGNSFSPKKTKRVAKEKTVSEQKPPQQTNHLNGLYEDHRNGGSSAPKKPFQGFKVRLGGAGAKQEQPQKMISVSSFRDYFAQRE